MSTETRPSGDPEVRVAVRPLGNPLPLGFLALMVATFGVAMLQLGVLLLCSAVAMVVTTAAATTRLAGMAVMGLSAVRFAVTGVGQLTGSSSWLTTAGWVGVLLGAVAAYAALAFVLEDARHATALPTGRRGSGSDTMTTSTRDELASVGHEAGVRKQL